MDLNEGCEKSERVSPVAAFRGDTPIDGAAPMGLPPER